MMALVDNNKIACFAPLKFRQYIGQTVLFDNAFRSRFGETPQPLACGLREPGQELYGLLNKGVNERIGVVRLIESYYLSPLPGATYHVTLCDGINQDNMPFLREEVRAKFEIALRAIPEVLKDCDIATFGIAAIRGGPPIRFEFSDLRIFEGAAPALVAALRPASGHEAAFERLRTWRKKTDESLTKFGIPASLPWVPHVSLGYFANSYYVPYAKQCLPRWTELIQREVDSAALTFSSASVYGFTDMVSFWQGPKVWDAQCEGLGVSLANES